MSVLFLRGGGSATGVLLTLLVSRSLPSQAAANFFLLFNLTMIAAVCFRWGLDEVIIRRVAPLGPEDSTVIARQLMAVAHGRVAVWVMFTLLCVLVVGSTSAGLTALAVTDLLITIGASGLVALMAAAARVQQAVGRTNFATLLLNILAPGLTLVFFLLLLGLGYTPNDRTLILLYAGVAAVAYVAVVSVQYGNPIALLVRGFAIPFNSEDCSAANKLGVVVLAQQALGWSALLFVPLAYGGEIYKSFVVVQKISTLISLVMLAINFTFSSRFAVLFAETRLVELRHIIRMALLGILSASIVASIFLFFFRHWILDFARIEGSVGELMIVLLLSQVAFSVAALFTVVLSMAKEEKFLLLAHSMVNGLGVIVFLLLCGMVRVEFASITFVLAYSALIILLGRRVWLLTNGNNKQSNNRTGTD